MLNIFSESIEFQKIAFIEKIRERYMLMA